MSKRYVDISKFPLLPPGFRWVVKYSKGYGTHPHFEAKVKGLFRTHASGRSYLRNSTSAESAPEAAARDAHKTFLLMVPAEEHRQRAKAWQATLNEEVRG